MKSILTDTMDSKNDVVTKATLLWFAFNINKRPVYLEIATWNANSMKENLIELNDFISEEELKALLLSEAWLEPQGLFSEPNSKLYRNDKLMGWCVRVVITVKNSIDRYDTGKLKSMVFPLPCQTIP